ncbi:MAG TPA: hypothetical protein VNO79_10780 [Actinomycetota bacterium]|nr:hypothetical protein [Actinomycetota bacterium]
MVRGSFHRLALAALLVAVGCTGRASRPVPRTAAHALLALWPEQSPEAAARVQRLADGGDRSVRWRLDPGAVALRFARAVLGWPHPIVAREQTWRALNGVELARVWLCLPAGCPTGGPAFDEEVVLKRVVRPGPGGIWSVSEVNSARLQFAPLLFLRVRDVEVPAGYRVRLFSPDPRDGGLPEGTTIVAGSVAWTGCGTLTETSPTRLWLQEARFQVATEGCGPGGGIDAPVPGYVFALRAVGAADPAAIAASLFDPRAPRTPAARLLDLTATAVRFLPRPGPIPRPPPPWLQDDPRTYPICRGRDLAAGEPSFEPGMPVGLGGGLAIAVELHRRGGGPCRVRARLSLTLEGPGGRPLPIRGNGLAVRVRGVLPLEEAVAAWWLRSWCRRGPLGDRVSFRISGLRRDLVVSQPFLRVPCTASEPEGPASLEPFPGI